MFRTTICAFSLVMFCWGCGHTVEVSGEARLWHTVTLTVDGPETSETAEPNPFTHYRVEAALAAPSGKEWTVPGFFAADGNAAETGAEAGNLWRVRFTPDEEGEWKYAIRMSEGRGRRRPWRRAFSPWARPTRPHRTSAPRARCVTSTSAISSSPVPAGASSKAAPTRPRTSWPTRISTPPAFAAASIPTSSTSTSRTSRTGRTATRPGATAEGKGIIGALNYLSSQGVNSIYFLTQNVNGDGDDVWPWIAPDDFTRFDVSKLEQWEIVFEHADNLGIQLHVVTAETENDRLLERRRSRAGPATLLPRTRRALRPSPRPAVEPGRGDQEHPRPAEAAFARYIHSIDPYDHPVVVHTFAVPDRHEKTYGPLLGYE